MDPRQPVLWCDLSVLVGLMKLEQWQQCQKTAGLKRVDQRQSSGCPYAGVDGGPGEQHCETLHEPWAPCLAAVGRDEQGADSRDNALADAEHTVVWEGHMAHLRSKVLLMVLAEVSGNRSAVGMGVAASQDDLPVLARSALHFDGMRNGAVHRP
jgi:hypothetical protein